ncbi:pantothenate kinase [Copromyces sp. CBS 386.78]|nr:pantothenate kinase [Copromyces sp. CBS 386.78]
MSSETYQAEAEAVALHPRHPSSRPQSDHPQAESHDRDLRNDGILPQADQLTTHLSPNAALTTPTTPTMTSPEIATASTPLTALTSATTSPPSANRQRASISGPIELDTALSHPGSVRINVKGAFIVEHGSASPPQTPSGSSSRGGSPSRQESKDIRLPNHTSVVSHIAVDIGGSLAKLVYFSREPHSSEPGGRLNFVSFETDHIDDCLEFMSALKRKHETLNGSNIVPELCVMATGGGAYKFYDMIRDVLGVDVIREDEMECLIIGLDFFITEIPREVFTYSEQDPMNFVDPSTHEYPYLLVNIGSGVSFLKVTGPRDYQRVGGTSLGGGTLWGLLSLLTGARSFDEMLDMASKGDNSKVDMLVGDIYGTDYGKIGLKSTTIASSFGKVFRMKRQAETEAEDSGGLSPVDVDEVPSSAAESGEPSTSSTKLPGNKLFSSADVSVSLLYAISNNIGQLAYLQSQIHELSHIYFGGSFIRGHPQTMNTLSYAIKFWSKGAKQAYFLRHEGYLGAVGAFLKRQPQNWGRRGSFDQAAAMQARMNARTRTRDSGDES